MAEQKTPRLSKRMKVVRAKVDRNKAYPLDDALKIVKETAVAKFATTLLLVKRIMLFVRCRDKRQALGLLSDPSVAEKSSYNPPILQMRFH